ncbi:2-deoxy-D-gluconate 3-dehydrogenase [Gammaproteobacteria bacterium 42_54_T18]|nr:2-deoxy-D-gluconate 3-dehydrogenase [Gammaproteobacteria bacterium 42_54_T18]
MSQDELNQDLLNIRDKVIMVTGASSGLGMYFAEALASRGATVVMGARRLQPLEALSARIKDEGGQALAIAMDVTSRDSVIAAFDFVEATYGGADVVVNNAGVAPNKPFLEQTEQDWDQALDTNLKGAFLVSQVFAERVIQAQEVRKSKNKPLVQASIINIASILASRVIGNMAPYSASKAGLEQLTKAMALELARYQIRVNAIAPGYVETDMNRDFFQSDAGKQLIRRIPQRQLGQLEDLLGPLCLLASEASRYMTGSVITVDGGHLVSSL